MEFLKDILPEQWLMLVGLVALGAYALWGNWIR